MRFVGAFYRQLFEEITKEKRGGEEMDKNSAKISLGTAVCMVIILILIVVLAVVYYLGFVREHEKTKPNLNAENNNIEVENKVQENDSLVESNENEFIIVYDALYKSLTEIKNNPKELFISNNKVEEVAILGIEINNYKYLYGEKWVSSEYPDIYNDDNLVIGTCKYGLKLDTLEGLSVAGSGDSKHIGDWFIDNKIFIYNKTTQTIELATGL